MKMKTVSASYIRPCFGERLSGDETIVEQWNGHLLAIIIDVLGHGPEAHTDAQKMREYIKEHFSTDVEVLLRGLHAHFCNTRGAAIGLCSVELFTGQLQYIGVGNTVARIISQEENRLYSTDGIVGGIMKTQQVQQATLTDGDMILLYTDGISETMDIDELPHVRTSSPSYIARDIVQRFGKRFDDASCIVIRYRT